MTVSRGADNPVVNKPITFEGPARPGVYRISYRCKCGAPYFVDWEPGRVEPPSSCPMCHSPTRKFVSSVKIGDWRGRVYSGNTEETRR